MRPWEREETSSSPVPARNAGGLSSMVVRLSDNGGGSESGPDHGGGRDLEDGHKEQSTPPLSLRRSESPRSLLRRRGSPRTFSHRRRRSPSPNFHQRASTTGFQNRGPPARFRLRESPPGFRSHSPTFYDNPGYGIRAGSPPLPRRPYASGYYDEYFEHPPGLHVGQATRGRRGGSGGRFRGISPPYGSTGRGGRSFVRGYNAPRRGGFPPSGRGGFPTLEGEYVHRNDPNLSPREGDWVCRNPSCGNLNFARRTYCNNCNEFRYKRSPHGTCRSPTRDYYGPPPRASSPLISAHPVDLAPRGNINGFTSPRRAWGAGDPQSFRAGSPLRGRALPERFDHREEFYKERRKVDWTAVGGVWASKGDGRRSFLPDRRGFGRRSVSPRGVWLEGSRERSRSPLRGRLPPGGYAGRVGDGGLYDSDYAELQRGERPDVGRGRGYLRAGGDPFAGRGRGRTWKER